MVTADMIFDFIADSGPHRVDLRDPGVFSVGIGEAQVHALAEYLNQRQAEAPPPADPKA